MGDREPFTQRMDPELYDRVEQRSDELGRTKASVFDEMMRQWLDGGELAAVREDLRVLEIRQESMLQLLAADGSGDAVQPQENGERIGEGAIDGPPSSTVITELRDYDTALPDRYMLSKAALRAVPEAIADSAFEIDPAHLTIDEFPRPVRVKRCLPVAVLRYEHDGSFGAHTVRETIRRVLGTERYADRYYSNVTRLLYELPTESEETTFVATESAFRAELPQAADEVERDESREAENSIARLERRTNALEKPDATGDGTSGS